MNDYKELIDGRWVLFAGVRGDAAFRHIISECGADGKVWFDKRFICDYVSHLKYAIEQLANDRNASVDALKALVENIDAVPVRHARWVDNHCTACGMMPMGDEMWKHCDFEPPRFELFMDYCPNCGAKMDEEVKHEAD